MDSFLAVWMDRHRVGLLALAALALMAITLWLWVAVWSSGWLVIATLVELAIATAAWFRFRDLGPHRPPPVPSMYGHHAPKPEPEPTEHEGHGDVTVNVNINVDRSTAGAPQAR